MNSQNPLILITSAASVAAEAHRSQKRKASDTPYVNHLIRVACECARAGLPPEAIAAAYLHDVLEDTELPLARLQAEFPERVVELVRLLTKWWSDHASAEIKKREKPRYYAAILRDQDAMAVKLLDRADNLQDMKRDVGHVRRWAERYHEKTAREIQPILEACTNEYACQTYRSALRDLAFALTEPRNPGSASGFSPG